MGSVDTIQEGAAMTGKRPRRVAGQCAMIGFGVLLLAALWIVLPWLAEASELPPAVVAAAFHLLFLSFIITAVETMVLVNLAGFRRMQTFACLFGGNLASGLLGATAAFNAIPPPSAVWSGAFPQWAVLPLVVMAWTAAFVATVLVEWPFVHAVGPPAKKSWRWSLRWSLAIQLASLPLIAAVYGSLHETSALTRVDVRADPREFAAEPLGTLLYLHEGQVQSMRLDGTGGGPFGPAIDPIPSLEGIALRAVEEDPDLIVLMHRRGLIDRASMRGRLSEPFPGRAPMSFHQMWTIPAGPVVLSYSFLSQPMPVAGRPAVRSAFGSLHVEGRRGWRRLATHQLGSDAPFRTSIVLPNGQAVLELTGRIYLFDPDGLRVAPLAEGWSPTVFYGIEEFDALGHEGLDLIRYTTPARPSP